MKRALIGGFVAVLGVAAAVGGGFFAAAHGPSGQPDLALVGNNDDTPRLRAVGLTADGELVTFRTDRPGEAKKAGKIAGLTGDTRLIGIDYRVQDGKLYGVGEGGGVYTVAEDGRATKVGKLSVALSGTEFDIDFNPAADRLRIVSDTGQNLRHNVNQGGTTNTDTTLTIPPATTPAAGVTAAAYTNNDTDAATATALYDIDTAMDQVSLQAPANSGQLSPIGKLGVDASPAGAGFDIYAKVRDGKAVDAVGFAVLGQNSGRTLYRISLITGKAEKVGEFGRGVAVTDLAVLLKQ
ncbi:hypothetical protein Val02_11020 [Virgisporangium aliadipatigenens]|uniref:DUF4394 domain-containing protein n=1 Tax=Virgisporangium aliadipatigenens TaxID=741659 RepID=A0A8J4DNV8_9ACTN|nr:DUF4394 domain-containing protein [Virgisporangium aliadipatigenens]GIJ44216.1 hypothetical protein Val02_11020 [Virgisporangium aliadipatigenens]